MSDENATATQRGGLQSPISITGRASGSQVVLVIYSIGGFVLLVGPVYFFASVGDKLPIVACVALYISMLLGVVALLAVYRMWHRSQPSVDDALRHAFPPIQSKIQIEPNAISIVGDDKFMRGRATQALLLQWAERSVHQRSLPPAYGSVEIDSSGKVIATPFTESEAAADAKRFNEALKRDQQRFRDFIRSGPLVSDHDGAASLKVAQDESSESENLESEVDVGAGKLVAVEKEPIPKSSGKKRRVGKPR